jgi:transposase
MANKPKRIDLTPQDLRALLERAKATLSKEDYEKIKAMAETIEALSNVVDQKASAIKRLLKLLFGQKSEKKKNVLGNSDDGQSDDEKNGQDNTPDESKPQEEKDPPKKRKGHGRNGASSYTGAKRVTVNHETLKHCDPCPLCLKGKVYRKTPETVIRIVGSPPLQGTVYEMEKLRCNLCGEIFTAKPPEDIGTKKHDETAAAIITLLKYGNGFPFYRLEQFQANLGVPVPATTQWGLVEGFASLAKPAYAEMLQQAAQGDLFYIDDTTGKILSLMKEGETEIGRKGIFTTGILSKMQDQVGVFYFTGRNHAGENIADLLQNRLQGLGPPGLMCDALSRNIPKDIEVILSNCLTHGRRNFVDIISAFPDECRHVIETLAQVYKNDKIAREKNMSPQERLAFHQAESKPLMDDLHAWFEKQFQEKRVEPNSGLGKAITYMMKHWKALTRFLEIPGAPLDNNICERALKKAIIHRKNSLFYKTRNGALVGDMFMSLIQTCNMARENAFDYLVALQKNASAVAANPQKWLPWNFRQAISSTNQ